jgi:hypothetical protein
MYNDRISSETPVKNNGAILEMEIYRSGKTKDGRVILRQEVREIYNNTIKYVLSENVTIPLKFGHDDRDQKLKGQIINLKLKRKKKKKGKLFSELYLIAEVHFFAEAYEIYKSDMLPNVSAEIAPEGYTEDGSQHGQYLAGLALLGTDPPAIPWLDKADFNNAVEFVSDVQFYNLYNNDGSIYYCSLTPGQNLYKGGNMEPKTFAIEDLMPIKDMATELLAAIDELVKAEEGEPEEEPTEPMASEDSSTETNTDEFDKDQRIKELEAELEATKNATKSDEAFSTLQEAGKVRPADKEIFSLLAQTAGLEKALETYSKRAHVKMPPMEAVKKHDLKTSKDKKEPWQQYEAKWFEKYKKQSPHKSDEHIQKLASFAAKTEYAKTIGGN